MSLSAEGATFAERELRASVLEQGVGELEPNRVAEHARELVASGEVIELEGGRMTTREIRDMEQAVQARISEMAASTGAAVSDAGSHDGGEGGRGADRRPVERRAAASA